MGRGRGDGAGSRMVMNWQEIERHAGRHDLHVDSSHGGQWRAALENEIKTKDSGATGQKA